MSTSVIAEGRAEQKAWQDEGQECKVKVAHCGGKSQDREKGIDRVGAEGETLEDAMQGLGLGVQWKEGQI